MKELTFDTIPWEQKVCRPHGSDLEITFLEADVTPWFIHRIEDCFLWYDIRIEKWGNVDDPKSCLEQSKPFVQIIIYYWENPDDIFYDHERGVVPPGEGHNPIRIRINKYCPSDFEKNLKGILNNISTCIESFDRKGWYFEAVDEEVWGRILDGDFAE